MTANTFPAVEVTLASGFTNVPPTVFTSVVTCRTVQGNVLVLDQRGYTLRVSPGAVRPLGYQATAKVDDSGKLHVEAVSYKQARETATDRLGLIGLDFPSQVIEYVDATGEVVVLDRLVTLAEDRTGEATRGSIDTAWGWLLYGDNGTGTLSDVEALAWLSA